MSILVIAGSAFSANLVIQRQYKKYEWVGGVGEEGNQSIDYGLVAVLNVMELVNVSRVNGVMSSQKEHTIHSSRCLTIHKSLEPKN